MKLFLISNTKQSERKIILHVEVMKKYQSSGIQFVPLDEEY